MLLDPNGKFTDPNVTDYAGNTPLHVAALRGHSSVVDALLKYESAVNRKGAFGKTPLAVAVGKSNAEIARAIHKAGGKLEWDETTAAGELCESAKVGNLERFKLLMECGASINSADYDKRTALHLAASVGSSAVIEVCPRPQNVTTAQHTFLM
jgi:ankyrin repeat protein